MTRQLENEDTYNSKKCKGILRFKVYEDGVLSQTGRSKNQIVHKMKDALAGILAGDPDFNITKIKLGTRDDAPTGEQGDLGNPIFEKTLHDIEFIEATNTARAKVYIETQEAPIAIYREAGLFTSNGKMVSRIIINPEIQYSDRTRFGIEWDLIFS